MADYEFDVAVIGSGFGGAVMACRLAEQGLSVLVLERGRRWPVDEYPSTSGENFFWNKRDKGWIDFRNFGDMAVASGAGVGGGSLIYANVVIDAKPFVFDQGWPSGIDAESIKPFYERVECMMNLQTLPDGQWTERTQLMFDAAEAMGDAQRFKVVPQAITFSPDWHYGLDDPFNIDKSQTWTNAFGQEQGTCVHCGNCDIGCPVKAKNTLDLNYLAKAEQEGAQVRPLHSVEKISPVGEGYRLEGQNLHVGAAFSVSVAKVVVSAGSIGSTELLLRCRDVHKTLPDLSRRLGMGWCSNGDFMTPASYNKRTPSPTQGPTISSAVDYLDGSDKGQRYFVEDGGFPDVLGNYLEASSVSFLSKYKFKKFRYLVDIYNKKFRGRDPLKSIMPWFGQAVDASNGRMYIGRSWCMPWKKVLKMDWDYKPSYAAVQALHERHLKMTSVTGGEALPMPTWKYLKNLVTPHPLGGCCMAESIEGGVVNDRGAVFGYSDLYVMDAAVVPVALGLNPSKTIAALAERSADLWSTEA